MTIQEPTQELPVEIRQFNYEVQWRIDQLVRHARTAKYGWARNPTPADMHRQLTLIQHFVTDIQTTLTKEPKS